VKYTLKKVVSIICVIAILAFSVVTPMHHTHTCHDTTCITDYAHACHDSDCVICLLFNKYQEIFGVCFLGFAFLILVNIKDELLILKTDLEDFLYNNLVKQKVKLTN
jgi:hypothetical protein